MDVNQTHCDQFTTYTNIKSLCYKPETNMPNYISILKNVSHFTSLWHDSEEVHQV